MSGETNPEKPDKHGLLAFWVLDRGVHMGVCIVDVNGSEERYGPIAGLIALLSIRLSVICRFQRVLFVIAFPGDARKQPKGSDSHRVTAWNRCLSVPRAHRRFQGPFVFLQVETDSEHSSLEIADPQ